MDDLTERVMEWQVTGRGLDPLMDDLSQIILRYLHRTYGWSEEECGRFFSDFYDRLLRMMTRYQAAGCSFQSYLVGNVRWFVRTYGKMGSREQWRSSVIVREAGFLYESDLDRDLLAEPSPGSRSPGEKVTGLGKMSPLYVALLQLDSLDDVLMAKLSLSTGVSETRIRMLVEQLRERMERRRNRHNDLVGRRNTLYCALLHLQYQYRETVNEEARRKLQSREQEIRQRLSRLRSRLYRSSWRPTHGDLAAVFGVPRATISTALYKCKLRKKALSSRSER